MIKDKNIFNILVVEDNLGDLLLIRDYLSEQIEQPTIIHAPNFTKAQEFLTNGPKNFDVILLDLSLPDKSGRKLVVDILEIAGSIPVIILTGYTGVDFSIQSISLGVSDYLIKDDLNSTALYKSITYCIERKKSILLLEESEKRYSDLFRLNPQPMWVYDPETYKIVQVNKAAIDHYGYSEQEFLKMTVLDIRDKKYYSDVMKAADPEVNRYKIFKGKFLHEKKNGDVIEVEIYSNFIMINNKEYKLVIANDITEKTLIDHQITRAIIKTQEDERYEIGAELHDNVCQILATSRISLGMLKESLDPSGKQLFAQCREYIDLAMEEIRNLSHRLAPAFFNDSSLEQAFEILLGTFNIEEKYKINLFLDKNLNKYKIDHDLQINLYRILQEQLRNILKYAKGTNVEVDLIINNNKLKMRIAEDGVGFDKNNVREGIGLANMKRRIELFYGNFEIFTSPGNGCEISIEIPMEHAVNKNI
jgi:PAS domain S-box-containing protein